jgi:hypothetical protein
VRPYFNAGISPLRVRCRKLLSCSKLSLRWRDGCFEACPSGQAQRCSWGYSCENPPGYKKRKTRFRTTREDWNYSAHDLILGRHNSGGGVTLRSGSAIRTEATSISSVRFRRDSFHCSVFAFDSRWYVCLSVTQSKLSGVKRIRNCSRIFGSDRYGCSRLKETLFPQKVTPDSSGALQGCSPTLDFCNLSCASNINQRGSIGEFWGSLKYPAKHCETSWLIL